MPFTFYNFNKKKIKVIQLFTISLLEVMKKPTTYPVLIQNLPHLINYKRNYSLW